MTPPLQLITQFESSRRDFLKAVGLSTAGLFIPGCNGKEEQAKPAVATQPDTQSVASRSTKPNKDLVERVYQATLERFELNHYGICFYKNGQPYFGFGRVIPDKNLDLKHKIIGRWKTGYATTPQNSSTVYSTILELLEDNRAKYWEESGGQRRIRKKDGTYEFQSSMRTVRGPHTGTWKIIDNDTIEIRLYVPKMSPPLPMDPPKFLSK